MTFLEAMNVVNLVGDGAVVRRASWVENGGFEVVEGQLEMRIDGDDAPSDEELLGIMLEVATYDVDRQAEEFDDRVVMSVLTPEDLAALDWLVE